ncbi:MAG: hypothetical protein ACRD2J_08250 [Thermoanaerobaculia bacterium]
MARQVKGVLFADYVRMLRAAKHVAWDEHLPPQDLQWLGQRIDPHGWYPMETYERMGLAILDGIAGGDLESVRDWGRRTIDELQEGEPDLFSARDPRETFMRFQVLRQTLFNFPAAEVISIRDGRAVVEVRYGMSARAEEAATFQSLGFLERLLEVSGARDVAVELQSRSWDGNGSTRIAIAWTPA